ncbi:MAG: response regulator [Desulfobacterales bacterium]|nr:response regulator [Desulfobacterales bacterium]
MSLPTRVLIVDDEISIRHSLSEFLSDYDLDVTSVESAEEALKLLPGESFEVAIVDIRLPRMSGEAFILQAHEISPQIRFLIHTGSVDYRISNDLERIGVNAKHVHIKPLPDLDKIFEAIEELMHLD